MQLSDQCQHEVFINLMCHPVHAGDVNEEGGGDDGMQDAASGGGGGDLKKWARYTKDK